MNEEKTNVKETKTSNKVLLFILVVVAIALIVMGIILYFADKKCKDPHLLQQ